MSRGTASAFAVGVVAFVLIATLTPAANMPPQRSICGIVCGELALADAILNFAFFVPVGLAMRLLAPRARAIAGGFLLSFLVEILQMFVPGRHASLGDLLFNTLGTVAGVMLLAALPRLLRPTRREAITLALAWSVFAVTVLFTGSWLLRPGLPASTYYGQWTPDLEGSELYRGEVLSAHIGGRAIPSWRLEHTRALRAQLNAGAPLEVVVVAGPAPYTAAPIFSIADQYNREILLVAARGHDLVYRSRVLASNFMLDRPDFRVAGAFARTNPGDTLRITVTPAVGSGPVRVRVNAREETARLTVADTWGLLVWPGFVARSTTARRIVGILWLIALAMPAVAWGTRALLAMPDHGGRHRPS